MKQRKKKKWKRRKEAHVAYRCFDFSSAFHNIRDSMLAYHKHLPSLIDRRSISSSMNDLCYSFFSFFFVFFFFFVIRRTDFSIEEAKERKSRRRARLSRTDTFYLGKIAICNNKLFRLIYCC